MGSCYQGGTFMQRECSGISLSSTVNSRLRVHNRIRYDNGYPTHVIRDGGHLVASLEERDDASRLIATCASGESVEGLGRRANEPYGFEFAMRSLVKLATLTGLLP